MHEYIKRHKQNINPCFSTSKVHSYTFGAYMLQIFYIVFKIQVDNLNLTKKLAYCWFCDMLIVCKCMKICKKNIVMQKVNHLTLQPPCIQFWTMMAWEFFWFVWFEWSSSKLSWFLFMWLFIWFNYIFYYFSLFLIKPFFPLSLFLSSIFFQCHQTP